MRRSLVSLALASLVFSSVALAAPQEKEWTLLVFMNGNNNLDEFGSMDLNEMETVGSNDKVNVVVQWASMSASSVKRVYVTKDNDTNTVTSPIVDDAGPVDMGDYRSLVDFVQWGVQHYPAKHYFIDVWNHGSGWHLQNKLALDGTKMHATDISWDEKSGNHMTTEQLGQALGEAARLIGHKVDIYGSDACLMGMAEVADEMADSVETFVGSEETEPVAGWPYDALLRGWYKLSDMSSQNIAKVLTAEYTKSYQGGTQGREQVTFSAYDLTKMHELNAAVKAFGDKLRTLDKPTRDRLVRASYNAQRYTYSDYVDFVDFLDKSQDAAPSALAGNETRALRDAIGRFVIANAVTESFSQSHGLAIWLPTESYSYDAYSSRYKGLRFAADTGWDVTLQALVGSDSK